MCEIGTNRVQPKELLLFDTFFFLEAETLGHRRVFDGQHRKDRSNCSLCYTGYLKGRIRQDNDEWIEEALLTLWGCIVLGG